MGGGAVTPVVIELSSFSTGLLVCSLAYVLSYNDGLLWVASWVYTLARTGTNARSEVVGDAIDVNAVSGVIM